MKAEKKLNILVDSYLDGTIEKSTYLQKKEELIKIKIDLHQKKSALGRKGETWIEPMKKFWNDAYLAKKLTTSNDFHEIKSFVAQHGTNRHLGGRKVSWLWVRGFKIVGDLAKIARARATNQNDNSFKIYRCFSMSG